MASGWTPVATTTIPRDDGTATNDWVTDPWWMHDTVVRFDAASGGRRIHLVDLRIELLDGSGSNSWTIEPVIVDGDPDQSDGRGVWPTPDVVGIGVSPRSLSDSELPFRRSYRVHARLCCYALRFVRSGAGTKRLRVIVQALL